MRKITARTAERGRSTAKTTQRRNAPSVKESIIFNTAARGTPKQGSVSLVKAQSSEKESIIHHMSL